MKRWIPWMAAAIVVVLLGGGVWRAMAARQAQQKALAEASTQRAEAPLHLAADEVVTVQSSQLSLGVPVSGSLRAVDSAMVKARVAGELQGLTLREGDTVKAGQEVARIDPTEARARLRQAQQQADAAKSSGQRTFTLEIDLPPSASADVEQLLELVERVSRMVGEQGLAMPASPKLIAFRQHLLGEVARQLHAGDTPRTADGSSTDL